MTRRPVRRASAVRVFLAAGTAVTVASCADVWQFDELHDTEDAGAIPAAEVEMVPADGGAVQRSTIVDAGLDTGAIPAADVEIVPPDGDAAKQLSPVVDAGLDADSMTHLVDADCDRACAMQGGCPHGQCGGPRGKNSTSDD
jgi:hypothetical protein